MNRLRRFLHRLLVSATRRHDDARVREEVETHIQMMTSEHIRAGMSAEEARRRAVLAFGPVEAVKGRYRDQQGLPAIDDAVQDVRYALRQLRRAPLFTVAAIVSLAMGIGANAAVFTVIERVLLRPLPVSNPHELVYVTDERILTRATARFSYPFYAALHENTVLAGVTARFALGLNASVNGLRARVNGELVSGTYFSVLGAGTEQGRPLSPEDDRTPGARPVAVISEPFWRRTLDADPAVVGRTIELNDHDFTIVGVGAGGFTGTDPASPTDVWVPLAMQRELGRDLLTDAGTNWLEIVGRVRPGQSTVEAAEALARHLEPRASGLPPEALANRLILLPADRGSSPMRQELGAALMVLFALTGLALALAGVNVACLAAVRSAGRERELAIRLALGAGRSRLQRQLLTEGLVLAALAGTLGALIAPGVVRALAAARPSAFLDTSVDPRMLGFVVVVSLLSGVCVAVLPMLASRRIGAPRATGRVPAGAGTPPRRLMAHDAIVALQIAMALAMLISAGLLAQSLRSFRSVDPGFRADNLLLASLDPGAAGYDATRIGEFWRATLDQVRRLPGARRASLARTVPLAPGRQRQGWRHPTSGEPVELDTNFVGPQYFETLDIPLLAGRDFTDVDGRTARPVVIVNERLADAFWPQQDPIGRSVRLPDSGNPDAEVVGVVRDVKYQDLRGEALPMFYRPVLQTRSTDALTLHVRASDDPDALVHAIRAAIGAVDPRVPVFRITTLEEQLDASFAQTRLAAVLSGTFGALALVLSAVGVYGVTWMSAALALVSLLALALPVRAATRLDPIAAIRRE